MGRIIERDTGTLKRKYMKETGRELQFMGELLKKEEEGVEGKQSIPICGVGSLAN